MVKETMLGGDGVVEVGWLVFHLVCVVFPSGQMDVLEGDTTSPTETSQEFVYTSLHEKTIKSITYIYIPHATNAS